jgi:RNA polymerase sigma-70 factor, ECF subfamily
MRRQGSTPGPTSGGASGRDAAAVACLRAFEQEFDYVYRALLRQGVAASDAEDLVQDVFLVTWRRWADFDETRPLRPWLAGIAFKVGSEHLKRRRRWEPRAWLDPPDQTPAGEEALAASRARALALRALSALPDRQRALIVLHDIDGLPMREIARIFTVPLFTAYSRLRAARRAFSDLVERALPEPSAAARSARGASAPALLALERTPPAAPAEVRRRSLSRIRKWLLLPAGPPLPLSPRSPLSPRRESAAAFGGSSGGLGAGAAAVVAILLAAGVGSRASAGRSRPPAGAATAGRAEGGPARAAAAVRPPAIRAAIAAEASDAAPPVAVVPAEKPADPLGRGLVGHWRFESGAAAEVADLSGHGNHCSAVRAPAAAGAGDPPGPEAGEGAIDGGRVGRPFRLDGGTFLSCARPEPLARLRTEITVSLWVQPAPHTRQRQVLIARQMGTTPERYFSIALENGSIELMSHAWRAVTRGRLPAAAGPWRHIAALHKDDGRTALYVDGKLVGRSNKSRRAHLGGGSSLLTIGGSVEGPGPADVRSLYAGAIDEVRIYDRALRPAELHRLAAGAPARDVSADNLAFIHQ